MILFSSYAIFNIKKYAVVNDTTAQDILLPIRDILNKQIGMLKVICTNKIYFFINHDLISLKFESIVDYHIGFG